ncbi:MAG: type II secretion system protein GspE, partial [Planctomycetota bacterium]
MQRFVDMGIARYLLGPAPRCIVGQRLVPRICADCAVPAEPTAVLLSAIGLANDTVISGFRRGEGCQSCRNR